MAGAFGWGAAIMLASSLRLWQDAEHMCCKYIEFVAVASTGLAYAAPGFFRPKVRAGGSMHAEAHPCSCLPDAFTNPNPWLAACPAVSEASTSLL